MSRYEDYLQLVETSLAKLTDTERPRDLALFHQLLRDVIHKVPPDEKLRLIASEIRDLPWWMRTPGSETLIVKLQDLRDHLRTLPSTGTGQTTTTPLPLKALPPKQHDLSGYTAMAGLTDRQRECFSLKFEHELTVMEIARRLDIDHSTVNQHIRMATIKLENARRSGRTPKKPHDD
jgi:DNA-binding CsgD family transcriptional regulator